QGDGGDQGGLVHGTQGDVVGHYFNQGRHRTLGQLGSGQPRQCRAPGGKGPQQQVVALGQVGLFVQQDGAQLVWGEEFQQPVREDGDGARTAWQAVGDGGLVVDDQGAGPVCGRGAEQLQQVPVAAALALD